VCDLNPARYPRHPYLEPPEPTGPVCDPIADILNDGRVPISDRQAWNLLTCYHARRKVF
jgi:hypothetical protein